MEKTYTLTVNTEKLNSIVKTKKEELESKLDEFILKYRKTTIDRQGNEVEATNPYLISTYFFKPINPINNVEPIYASEQLALVYNLYSYIVEQINLSGMTFQPTLSHFAKFSGLTLSKFNELKSSPDEAMRVLIERINYDIFDANVMLSQHGVVSNPATEYRMKIENEMIPKKAPSINVNVKTKEVDLDKINARIASIRQITSKQNKYEGK